MIPTEGTGKYGDSYTTTVSSEIPTNYEYVTRTDNWEGTNTRSRVEYRLVDPNITNQDISKTATESIDNPKEQIEYRITYTTTIENYIGRAQVTIVDTLPYKIDVTRSSLNGGTYDEESQTITWVELVDGIDTYENPQSGNIEINKTIKVVYQNIDVSKENIENNVSGKVKLFTPENISEEVTDTATTNTELKMNLTINKIWDDQENIYDKRPASIKLVVKRGENIVKSAVVTQDNNWSATFTDLPKYDENGQEIEYTVDEEEVMENDLFNYEKEIGEITDKNLALHEKEATITNTVIQKPSTVVVKYVDKYTGEEISDSKIKEGIIGDTFDVTEDKKEIDGYTLVEEPAEKTGKYTVEPQEKSIIMQKIQGLL